MFEMIAFDVAGTTVMDDGLVIRAFEKAFSFAVPEQWQDRREELTQYALDTMGQSKIEVFTAMLGRADLAQKANVAFEAAYYDLVLTEGVTEITGARAAIEKLRAAGIPVGLTTGFSRSTLDAIVKSLGWADILDATVVPGEVGAGRPSPLMLQKEAALLGATNPENCVIVGDTISDMEAGVAFGAGVRVGVLSGAHDAAALGAAGATLILDSVAALPAALLGH